MSAQKWAQNLSRSTDSIKAGVQAVQEAPTARAARSLDKARMNYNQAIDSGRMARSLQAVTLSDWQQAFINKGIPRIQSGAAAGQSKYQQFAAQFYPIMDQVSQQVKGMPNVTTEDALARVRVAIEAGKRFAGKV